MTYRIYEHEDGLEVVTTDARFECRTYVEARAILAGYNTYLIECAEAGTTPMDHATYVVETTGHMYPWEPN